ncbi:ATP-binding protein [Mesorhizobium sp. J428]|uniref:ATP-binding protein n=1 Tax=Mesorhizobium sp. J428 TaxID=2898440 RepID=UPI002151B3FC|nr:ATP-binding protein [Mesorhizobium sp. J428]MCR5859450.1 ATP-binding protein [Mesorhizobium sp. J428]
MFKEHEGDLTERNALPVRDAAQEAARILGHVIQCDGAHATIATTAAGNKSQEAGQWSVGKFISISLPNTRTVGLVHDVHVDGPWYEEADNRMLVHVDLIGEVRDGQDGAPPVFDRGIAKYPHIGAIAHRIRQRDLAAIYEIGGNDAVPVGNLSQDESISANVAMGRTLNRHFAVVGSTGVGKSSAVSLLLHKAIEARPNLRVLILDPHNEFASAFPDVSTTLDSETLDLPFWMFRLEELVEVLYLGRDPIVEEVELLRELIPAAKHEHRGAGNVSLRRASEPGGITADTPVPYRMADLMRILDDRMGMLDSKDLRPVYRALRQRLDAGTRDPRFRFMFGSRIIEDNITAAIGLIFRIPTQGKPVTCFQMAGMPSEVVNAVCSVLARLAFDLTLWGDGQIELLLLCEEAHRYMPVDPRMGFAPTRHALARIAKEGRKYGCYLGIVTQRPGELDPTIFSQCSTVFAMRLPNEQDQAIIRSAISDASASALAFLSSMGQRECIAFGDGVAATMRMKFEVLDRRYIPGSAVRDHTQDEMVQDIDLNTIVERMRSGGRDGFSDEVWSNANVPAAPAAGGPEQRPSLARLSPYVDEPIRQERRPDGRLFG